MSTLASPSGGLATGLFALAVVAIASGVLVLSVPLRPALDGASPDRVSDEDRVSR